MSSNIIFKAPGRTTTYMPIDVNTPKDEIYTRYARLVFYLLQNEQSYNFIFLINKGEVFQLRMNGHMNHHQLVIMILKILILN